MMFDAQVPTRPTTIGLQELEVRLRSTRRMSEQRVNRLSQISEDQGSNISATDDVKVELEYLRSSHKVSVPSQDDRGPVH
jgi:hypothetical protein